MDKFISMWKVREIADKVLVSVLESLKHSFFNSRKTSVNDLQALHNERVFCN